MIIGAHSIIYSTDAAADRTFLRDVLKLRHVDAGGGWLIFGLPSAEVAVHPSATKGFHELYLMCENVARFVSKMRDQNIVCSPVTTQTWGLLTQVTLPGGGKLGVYQPRHPRPKPMTARRARVRSTRRVAKRPTRKARARLPKKAGQW